MLDLEPLELDGPLSDEERPIHMIEKGDNTSRRCDITMYKVLWANQDV